ncbi:bifunctional transaldolase/phosoglucose isomerase, partial [mine drainage metagenome]
PNLLIKVPATPEGIPAIQQLLSENINVNITLMFSLAHYEAVAQAYLAALGRSSAPSQLGSVASIFVSRIDTAVDKLLDASTDPRAKALKGKIAIANSRVIYARFQELFEGSAFSVWTKQGARPQRLLWASTSTKDPSLRDTLYVEELVGPETVDTIPPATLAAFEDHGVVRGNTVTEGVPEARDLLKRAKEVGIDLARITEALQIEGVAAFAASYAQLLASLDTRKKAILAGAIDPTAWSLGPAAKSVELRIQSWQDAHVGDRLWRGDPTLWPAAAAPDVADRLGWLRLPEMMRDALPELLKFAEEVRADGTRHVVVLGMGGSSLAPDVFRRIFGPRGGYPELLVLDSTHPDAIREVQGLIDPRRTLFVVSSKSGTTTEPLSFHRYFWEVLRAVGEAPERRFIAVTDPGTPLEKLAQDLKFRATFRALPTVGGRYSALTMFGLVPATLCGVDVPTLLDRARTMSAACAPSVPVPENPALRLGARSESSRRTAATSSPSMPRRASPRSGLDRTARRREHGEDRQGDCSDRRRTDARAGGVR